MSAPLPIRLPTRADVTRALVESVTGPTYHAPTVSARLYSCAACPKGGQCPACVELDAASEAIRARFDANEVPTEAERQRWEAACVASDRGPR